MSPIGPETVLLVFLLFCRIGGCLMLMPGVSSVRVPAQVRLFIALAVTLALAPMLEPSLRATLANRPSAMVLSLIISEVAVGALIGVMGRIFFLALQFMAMAAAMFVGFGSMPGTPIEDTEPLPALATLITLTATVLLFLTDQHWEVLRALLASYVALPMSEPFAIDFSLAKVVGCPVQRIHHRPADHQPVPGLCADRQSHGGPCQQADPADPGLLHRHALRPRRRLRHPLPHDRRVAAAVHDGLHGLAGGGVSMSTRAERTRRVLALQEQLHRVERWKLLDLQRRAAELDALRRELIAALNDSDALRGCSWTPPRAG